MLGKNDLVTVKELDERYSIVVGYYTDTYPDTNTVYDSEEEALQNNDGKIPFVGFVIYDKEAGDWADFAEECFASYDKALERYKDSREQENVPVLQLNEHYGLTLVANDSVDGDCATDGFSFCFFDFRTGEVVSPDIRFETCEEAVEVFRNHTNPTNPSITDFKGDYAFLGNGFDHYPVIFSGREFRTAEGAFQSCKCPEQADRFVNCTAKQAKAIGRKVPLRSDWNAVRSLMMYKVLVAKFSQNETLKKALLDTGDALIEPHNLKHENYWGSCECAACASKKKENRLGLILMLIREDLRNAPLVDEN